MSIEENKVIAGRYGEEIWGKGDLTAVRATHGRAYRFSYAPSPILSVHAADQ